MPAKHIVLICCLTMLSLPLSLAARADTAMRLKRPVSSASYTVSVPVVSTRAQAAASPSALGSFIKQNFATAPALASTIGSAARTFGAININKLQDKDVVVIIDKSNSMSTKDAPYGLSRWDWTGRQLHDLAGRLRLVPRSKLDLVLFDNKTTVYDDVTVAMIPQIFSRHTPSSGTNVTGALKEQIDTYFNSGSERPMVIAVITDGAPSNSRSLKDLLVGTTHKLNNPGQLKITFLQVGNESQGDRLLPELDNDLIRQGAMFDIVASKSFASLSRDGLVRSLIESVD
ncbi:MAG: VWA domain-containing protein [Candidatus Obscuribacterales bacterium]|nr:VWA domain-containing protein [Candidatus Obscuribacterales bacterium]